MKGALTRRVRVTTTLVGLLLSVAAAGPVSGQSVGYGASPGRAAYRPSVQWNDGPYFTTPHINPYAPHPRAATNLYEAEPLAPPWSTAPHGLYSTFYPGRGVLYGYDEGFSPYSGFSAWYARTYNIVPTREVVQQGRSRFFRSAPLPPAGVLPPLPPGRPVMIAPTGIRQVTGTAANPPNVTAPGPPQLRPRAGSIPVYRSSVAGGS